jgi:DNA-binding transcriptional MerR regulator
MEAQLLKRRKRKKRKVRTNDANCPNPQDLLKPNDNGTRKPKGNEAGGTTTLKERRYIAFKLRQEGNSFREIKRILAEQYGHEVSDVTVYRDVKETLKRFDDELKEQVPELRAMEATRLEHLINNMWKYATNPRTVTVHMKNGDTMSYEEADYRAIETMLKVMQRKAKMLGLDAPEKKLLGEDEEHPFRGLSLKDRMELANEMRQELLAEMNENTLQVLDGGQK